MTQTRSRLIFPFIAMYNNLSNNVKNKNGFKLNNECESTVCVIFEWLKINFESRFNSIFFCWKHKIWISSELELVEYGSHHKFVINFFEFIEGWNTKFWYYGLEIDYTVSFSEYKYSLADWNSFLFTHRTFMCNNFKPLEK